MLVEVAGGDAEPYRFSRGVSFVVEFEAGLLNSQAFNFVAVDEEDPELQEDVELTLTILSGGAVVGIETVVMHPASDLEYPVATSFKFVTLTTKGCLTASTLHANCAGWCTAGTTTRKDCVSR